jgi:hypothetical protein
MSSPQSLELGDQAKTSEQCLPHLTLQSQENESAALASMPALLRMCFPQKEAKVAEI